MKGAQSEQKFLDAWRPSYRRRFHYCQIIKSVRRATWHEDHRESTDMVIETRLKGKPFIRVQIKSSTQWTKGFLKKGLDIVLVVIERDDNPREIRRKTIAAIVSMYPYLAERFERRGCIPPQKSVYN